MKSKLFDFANAIDDKYIKPFLQKNSNGITNALEINLKNGAMVPIKISDKIMGAYLGGRALAIRLFAEYAVGSNPKDNPVIITSSPSNNTLIPYGDSFSIAFQSPVTTRLSVFSSNCRTGACMRTLGLDAIILQGCSDKTVTLNIENNPSIRIEEGLSGLSTSELDKKLRGSKTQSILVCGPSADNQAPFSTLVCESTTIGRGGLGMLMMQKQVKAIIVTPDEEKLKAPLKTVVSELKKSKKPEKEPKLERILNQSRYLSNSNNSELNLSAKALHVGFLPVCNFRYRTDPRMFYLLSRKDINLSVYKTREITNPLLSHQVETYPYSNLCMLGSNLGCFDIEKIQSWISECIELGLDPISVGNVIGWAIDERKNGRLEDYPELDDVSKKMILRIINRLANPRGKKLFGLMALGAEVIKNSGEYNNNRIYEISGLECGPFDYRGFRAMAIEDYYGYNLNCPCEPLMPLYTATPKRLARFIIWNNNIAEGLESVGFSHLLMGPILCEREGFWSFLSYFFPSLFLKFFNPALLSKRFKLTTGIKLSSFAFRDIGVSCYLLETGINQVICQKEPQMPPYFYTDSTSASSKPQIVQFVKLKGHYERLRLHI